MREILFRGKCVNNGDWVTGVYYKQTEYYGDPCEEHYIITSTEDLGYDQALDYYKVDPKTVGQFTGLYNKNSQRIFEGDIFEYADDCRYKVVWSDDKVGFYADGLNFEDFDFLGNFYEDQIEIIGNIHDNPKLLEDKI